MFAKPGDVKDEVSCSREEPEAGDAVKLIHWLDHFHTGKLRSCVCATFYNT